MAHSIEDQNFIEANENTNCLKVLRVTRKTDNSCILLAAGDMHKLRLVKPNPSIMKFDHYLKMNNMAKSIASTENYDDFDLNDQHSIFGDMVGDWVKAGHYTKDAFLNRMTIYFNTQLTTLRPIFDIILTPSDSNTLDAANFVKFFGDLLSPYRPGYDLKPGLKLFYQVFQYLAAHPFEPDYTKSIDRDSFHRALCFLFKYRPFGGQSIGGGKLGPYPGKNFHSNIRLRQTTPTDWRRTFFRALAKPKSKQDDTNTRFRKVPVTYYEVEYYDTQFDRRRSPRWTMNSFIRVDFQVWEDERQIDLLDIAESTNPDKISGETGGIAQPTRVCFRPILQANLPTHQLYLDQMSISTRDLKAFMEVLFFLEGHNLDLDKHLEMTHIVPNDSEEISWEEFDCMISENSPDWFQPPFQLLHDLLYARLK